MGENTAEIFFRHFRDRAQIDGRPLAFFQDLLVPRARALALVAAHDPISDQGEHFRSEIPAGLDRQGADAPPDVHPVVAQRTGRAVFLAFAARFAGTTEPKRFFVGQKRQKREFFGREDRRDEEKTPKLRVDQHPVPPDEAQAGGFGVLTLQKRRRIDDPSRGLVRERGLQLLLELFEPFADHVVVIDAARGVLGHPAPAFRERIPRGVLREFVQKLHHGPVAELLTRRALDLPERHAEHDDRPRPGQNRLGRLPRLGIFPQVVEFAVHPGREPLLVGEKRPRLFRRHDPDERKAE